MSPVTVHNSTFYNDDCISGAAEYIPEGIVDLIVTDPPYGISGHLLHRHYNRNEDYVMKDYVEVPAKKYATFSEMWIRQAERVLRPGGTIYIISGYTNLIDILNALRNTSLREVNHIIWKYRFGVFTKNKYISSHYHILFYEKPGGRRTFNPEARFGFGDRADDGTSLNNTDREDVWIIKREYKAGKIKNKNELPTPLLTKMIQYSSNEGDLVCDFFLGGFSTARTAIELNRRMIGFEISVPVFERKVKDLYSLQPGSLLSKLRSPKIYDAGNAGKRWSDDDLNKLREEYDQLRAQGKTKTEIIATICRRLRRGRFSIANALKKNQRGGL